jgi:hypothetical protein
MVIPSLGTSCSIFAGYRSLAIDPFADILRTILELRSVGLHKRKKLHSVTVNDRHVLEIDSERARFLSKQIPQGVDMFPGELPAYEEHDQIFSIDSIYSETHRLRPIPRSGSILQSRMT